MLVAPKTIIHAAPWPAPVSHHKIAMKGCTAAEVRHGTALLQSRVCPRHHLVGLFFVLSLQGMVVCPHQGLSAEACRDMGQGSQDGIHFLTERAACEDVLLL